MHLIAALLLVVCAAPLDQATAEAHRRKLVSRIDPRGPIIDNAGIQAD